jgi:acetyl-CoA C-acetyltransferase
MTKFGRHDGKTLLEIMVEASLRAIDDAKIGERDVDAVYVSTMLSGELSNQTALGSALVDQLGLMPAAAHRLENGPASGGSAVKNACMAVASGFCDLVLVTGGEKMRHISGDRITDLISTMVHPTAEYVHGVTLPALAAMFTRLYMHRYGLKREHLAKVAIKNHANALKNPYAHIHQPITIEGILYAKEAEVNNPLVADPLRLFDCCPVTDGAASVVLCAAEIAKEFCDTPVIVAGLGQATDTLAVHEREDPTLLKAVQVASQKAFKMAKLTPADMDLAELHDAFTILEIAESEDSGFFAKGTGHKALEEDVTSLGGKLPINPSGGLKARGHPVGATGVAQIVELTWQLRGEAGGRQVQGAEKAYCCNFGGFGNNVISFVLTRRN